MSNINFFIHNNERVLPVCFYGKNRNHEVLDYHKKVFQFFGFPMNYIEWPFHMSGHGDAIMDIVRNTFGQVDYYLFIDMDAIPLRGDFWNIIYDKIKDKNSVFGPAWTSNHKSPNHIHAACCFLAFSSLLYQKLGFPDLRDRIARSDNGEELSWAAAECGETISLIYPSDYYALTKAEHDESGNPIRWNLGNKFEYGLGTTYGDLFFHSGMQSLARSSEIFIRKSKRLIGEYLQPKLEGIIVSVNFSDFLSLSLEESSKYLEHIVVVTSNSDKKTEEICSKYLNVSCIKTDIFWKNGAKFNKGGAIREAFKHLKHKDWILNLDADIILPFNFDLVSDHLSKLDVNKFYGSGRAFVYDYKSYLDIKRGVGRYSDFEYINGAGCGFFQLWNANSRAAKYWGMNNLYTDCNNAGEVDIDFLKKFCPKVEHDTNLVDLKLNLIHLGQHGVYRNGRSEQESFFAGV